MASRTAASTVGSSTLLSVLAGPAVVASTSAVELAAEAVGQHLLQLGEGAGAGLLHAGDARGRAQPDGDRHGLLVVEEQGRQLRADAEAVAAAGSADGVDGVAELPEPGHVVADRSVGHAEPARQVRAGPVGPGLQQ